MKKIVLSFDDSREDFYTRVFPLLKKYNIPAALNVISGFVNGTAKINMPSADNKAMTSAQVVECQQSGLVEIACHGATHDNTKEGVLRNIEEMKAWGVNVDGIGFASPTSILTKDNIHDTGIDSLVEQGIMSYVRSGIRTRREGLVYSAFTLLDSKIHNNGLFYRLNKRCIIGTPIPSILPSVAVNCYHTLPQITNLIKKMKEGETVILNFHSVLRKTDAGYGKDKFYWEEGRFEKLLKEFGSDVSVKVCTTKNLF